MIIQSIKINKKILFSLITIFLIISLISGYLLISKSIETNSFIFWNNMSTNNLNEDESDYIKWVDFKITSDILLKTAKLDIDSHNSNSEIQYNWIELLAYLACKNGGNFKNFNQNDLNTLLNQLNNGKTIEELTQNMKYYNYYYESYSTVLGGFIGNFSIEVENSDGSTSFQDKYGIKAFLPIAKNYAFSHYDDFGASRSYGFKRTHLGNDLMGSIGTPIIAVESGTIEHLGWNQYGGWRIGIRSFDKKRYYYYAHLRKDHPFPAGLVEGGTVTAGDVIRLFGYDWL